MTLEQIQTREAEIHETLLIIQKDRDEAIAAAKANARPLHDELGQLQQLKKIADMSDAEKNALRNALASDEPKVQTVYPDPVLSVEAVGVPGA